MAPKRPSPLDEPPAASSSEEAEEASSEEEEEEEEEDPSEDEDEDEQEKTPKKTSTSASKPQPSESEDESSSDSEPADLAVKPIASKPMEESATPAAAKPKKTRSKPSATPAKRAGETEPAKSSKRAKKKGSDAPEAENNGASAASEDEPKKSGGSGGGDEKKLFQRLWSEDDEIVILKGMIDYAAKKGSDPSADMGAFHDFIKKSLHIDVSKSQLADKVRRLRKKYENNSAKKKYDPSKPHEKKAFELSKKIWGSSGEEPRSNGTAVRTAARGNGKTLSSLKAELLSSPDPAKDVEKMEIDENGVASGSEILTFDKSLPEYVVKQGLGLVSEEKKAELAAKWRKIHVAELELFVKRTQLISEQTKLILEALKSSDR